jgi:hypothetical protein
VWLQLNVTGKSLLAAPYKPQNNLTFLVEQTRKKRKEKKKRRKKKKTVIHNGVMFLLMQAFINCFKRRQMMYFGLMFYDIISLLYVHVEAYSMYMQVKWNNSPNQHHILQQNSLFFDINNKE